MTPSLRCLTLLLACGLAMTCKADYLFTYQDNAGNVIGFSEPTLQPSGSATKFLFDKNSVNSFVFQGNAPSTCGALGSLDTGCTALTNSTGLGAALFPNGSFSSPGVFSGSNGATVDITQYSGYLFTFQDAKGNILAFSEPTLQSSASTNQFLFSTAGVTSFSFSSDAFSCGALGSTVPIGCTELNNSLGGTTVFPAASFSTVGSFSSGGATANIVQATATPEPATAALFPLALILAGAFRRRQLSGSIKALAAVVAGRSNPKVPE